MPEIPLHACISCGALLDAAANFCSRCGTIQSGPAAPTASPKTRWYHNIWFVLFMLFFVLGPFGLPLVWKNPRFSRGVKVTLTFVMIVYTAVLIEVTMKMVQAVSESVKQFQSTLSY